MWALQGLGSLAGRLRGASTSGPTFSPQLEGAVMPYLQALAEFRAGVRTIARERHGEAAALSARRGLTRSHCGHSGALLSRGDVMGSDMPGPTHGTWQHHSPEL